VRDMNSKGRLTIRYSQKVMNTSVINETVIEIKVREGPDNKGNKTIIGWNVTRIGDREHEIQILFA
jgi:hypothetical protein